MTVGILTALHARHISRRRVGVSSNIQRLLAVTRDRSRQQRPRPDSDIPADLPPPRTLIVPAIITWMCMHKLSCRRDSARRRSLRRSRSFKVTDVSTNRKPVCDFLVVNNTNLHRFSHHFYRAACNCRRGTVMRFLSVCPSVCLSVCQTRDLWQNGRKIGPDFYTIRKNI